MIVATDSGALIGFLSLKMCLLPFPFVDTFFSDAGALYLVLLSRADLLWISCLDCLPPPLLGWVLEDMEGPDAPPLLLFPVQLLQRISPWFPFFHIDEELVLQTAQLGFSPSGIVSSAVRRRSRVAGF